MPKPSHWIGIISVAALLISGWNTPSSGRVSEVTSSTELKPFMSWSGPDSRAAEREYFLIRNEKQWAKVWQLHTGVRADDTWKTPPSRPVIDFDTCMLVAIFQGRGFNSRGVILKSLTDEPKRLLLRFDDASYQTDATGDRVTPFGFFLMAKSDKLIVLEENVQGLLGQPPKWKVRAELTPH